MKKNINSLLRKSLIILLVVFGLTNFYCQNALLKDTESAKIISRNVTKDFTDNKIEEAFNTLSQYWPLPVNEINNLKTQTIQSINLISERYGKAESFVKVSEQNIKDAGFRETYLVKFEYTAVRLIFTYYKNSKGWLVNGFKWDSEFGEEFK
ncbi:MAG: hypothetical protein I8H68_11450 [Flavobacteriia bacterium]|nr:hypothetical protein [Flavobacteriia bacterium]MBH2024772.1 hypothetical protein [Flavobacteriales bacterium]